MPRSKVRKDVGRKLKRVNPLELIPSNGCKNVVVARIKEVKREGDQTSVTILCKVGKNEFEARETAKRFQLDIEDPEVGTLFATSYSLQKLSAKIFREAEKRMKQMEAKRNRLIKNTIQEMQETIIRPAVEKRIQEYNEAVLSST